MDIGNRHEPSAVTKPTGSTGVNAVSPAFTPSELLTASTFPHPVFRLEVRTTNISWVILTGPYAYKIKRTVDLGFINTSTLAKRKHLCEEELRLNRRLAPDLYVDVVAITRDASGVSIGGNGEIIEYAVRMHGDTVGSDFDQQHLRRQRRRSEPHRGNHRRSDRHGPYGQGG